MKNNKGIALIFTLYFLMIAFALSGAMLVRAMTETKAAGLNQASMQAFYFAEGGLTQAEYNMKHGSWLDCSETLQYGSLNYEFSIVCLSGNMRQAISKGWSTSPQQMYVERIVEGIYRQKPNALFDSAIAVSNSLNVSGTSNLINGDVTVSDAALVHPDANITGDIIVDPSVSPLPELDWDYLRGIAESQNNVYDIDNQAFMPQNFYYASGVPNIVIFDEAMLDANGNIALGGFIIINPRQVGHFVQNGNALINGCIYVNGDADFNGGGDRELNGCVLAGDDVQLNGGIEINYNEEYVNAIRNISLNDEPELVSWRQLK